ncbi:telomere length regulator protein Rif1 [Schizosaccharomyces pombe]|uniref:Telomere length regulator protein rif1 n=1 Tax=Schizosaccharomyces pombe (strain 972 / ATCC 24843) TaxID=284812 RepID=RIF1_SCHPO|nr:telomere length regulator Rif1 [Schizosaccharomyces pombe]Q96UP3.1 RecName: Full=Telomere length regulator protein rif1 [Schizosaccharomyces pombe 972h-]AAK57741.1 Tap1 [Schizosaccharomyces pombe]CAB11739.3 telomere length regulator protein Rif1 [Schizosaccharomyces pombe]|eukprot:NP_593910.2 telomere length regulator Rif1 [Schizosaccharomyces pombe]
MTKEIAVKEASNMLLQEPSTPSSQAVGLSSSPSSSIRKKKVNFSSELENSPGGNRPSFGLPKRGILKTSTPLSSIKQPNFQSFEGNESEKETSLQELQSSFCSGIENLQHVEKSARIETYSKLSSFLKIYTPSLPEDPIFPLLNQLCNFLLSDRCSNNSEGSPDFQLNTQANKLLSILLWHPTISSHIQPETATVFIEQSLNFLEGPKLTKALAAQHLHLLSCQKCPLSIHPLCNRILDVCFNISFPSLVIGQERLAVLTKILSQFPLEFSRRVVDWAPYLLACLVDASRPIREKALLLALDLSKHLYHDKLVARTILANFRSDIKGTAFVLIMTEQFEKLVIEEDDGVYVAHAWAAIISVLGGARISSWEYFNTWLKIIQLCFNSMNPLTKCAAQTSWIRLIHEFSLSETLTQATKRLTLLCQPISMVLGSRNLPTVKNAAMTTLIALIYACLRPGISDAMLSLLWDSVIVNILEKCALKNEVTIFESSNILLALFNTLSNGVWKDDRLVCRESVEAKELPKLNPVWVRANCSRTIEPVKTLLLLAKPDHTVKTTTPARKQHIRGLSYEQSSSVWSTYIKCLASAGQKEIKRSVETGRAICCICSSLHKFLYSKSIRKDELYVERVSRFALMVKSAIEAFGINTFVEASYLVSDNQLVLIDQTKAIDSYDHVPISPLIYLLHSLALLTNGTLFSTVHAAYSSILSSIEEYHLRFGLKLMLLWDCVSPLSDDGTLVLARVLVSHEVSRLTSEALLSELKSRNGNNSVEEGFSEEERSILLKLLSWNVKFCSISDAGSVNNLLQQYFTAIYKFEGCGSVFPFVVDPFTTILDDVLSFEANKVYSFAISLMKVSTFESCTKELPPVTLPENIRQHLDSYNHMVELYNTLLQRLSSSDQVDLQCRYLHELSEFIKKIPKEFIFHTICKLSKGLIPCFLMNAFPQLEKSTTLQKSCTNFCILILQLLLNSTATASNILESLSPLLTSGLKSISKEVVLAAIKFWNQVFGKFESEEYPIELQKTISYLSKTYIILLPFQSLCPGGKQANHQSSEKMSDILKGVDELRSVSKNGPYASSQDKGEKTTEFSGPGKPNNDNYIQIASVQELDDSSKGKAGKMPASKKNKRQKGDVKKIDETKNEATDMEESLTTPSGKVNKEVIVDDTSLRDEAIVPDKAIDVADNSNALLKENISSQSNRKADNNGTPSVNNSFTTANNDECSKENSQIEPEGQTASREGVLSTPRSTRKKRKLGRKSQSSNVNKEVAISEVSATLENVEVIERHGISEQGQNLDESACVLTNESSLSQTEIPEEKTENETTAVNGFENSKKRQFSSLLSGSIDTNNESNKVSSVEFDKSGPQDIIQSMTEATFEIEKNIQDLKSEEVQKLSDLLMRLQRAILSRIA